MKIEADTHQAETAFNRLAAAAERATRAIRELDAALEALAGKAASIEKGPDPTRLRELIIKIFDDVSKE